jgi:hypothetical protein
MRPPGACQISALCPAAEYQDSLTMSTGKATCGFISAPMRRDTSQDASLALDSLLCEPALSGVPSEVLQGVVLDDAAVILA